MQLRVRSIPEDSGPTVVTRRPRVALIWPGGVFGSEGNFGTPQLLSLASVVQASDLAEVTIYDLDAERAQGGFSPQAFQQQAYDVVGISCYSSYDYLKVMALAAWLRPLAKDAWFVTGGYHPSARPADLLRPDSPFQYVVVGEAEKALVELVRLRQTGQGPKKPIVWGCATEPSSTLPTPFWLLERYRDVFQRTMSRVELYLSRGCPYGCSFCMEQSKRQVSWRALSVDEAIEQLERLASFLDLHDKTLRIVDAVFGLDRGWRRDLLGRLAQRPLAVDKIWLLTRADQLEREDFELMSRANVAPGFGVESGDPALLGSTGKLRGAPERFLDRLFELADWAREFHVPFGANLIVGLPGETEGSLRRTARYLDRLFLGAAPSVGFFGVDRFRLYPGSGIAENLSAWQARTGFVPRRPEWWHDGDQDFLSEWNDPSGELGYERTMDIGFELFAPRLQALSERFAYQGPARKKFLATIKENRDSWSAAARARQRELSALWSPLIRTVPEARQQGPLGVG